MSKKKTISKTSKKISNKKTAHAKKPKNTRYAQRLTKKMEDPKVRSKMNDEFGRVRAYFYRTGRVVPSQDVAQRIKKIAGI